jgi:hypothetical protein
MPKAHLPEVGEKFGPNKHKPYTYLLKCLVDNTFYYGVKFSKNCCPEDFWIKYETSSKEVKSKIQKYGKQSFSFEIRKTFDDSNKARRWETKVLRRMKVVQRTDFMNKTDNISIQPMYGSDNPMTKTEVIDKFKKSRAKNPTKKPNGEETYKIISEKLKGRKRPEEVCKSISKALKGYKHDEEFKQKCRDRQLGVKPSEENKRKKSESIKGRKKFTDGKKIIFRKPGEEPEGFYMKQ